MYQIKPLQQKKAKSIGVTIEPSYVKNKKIAVLRNNKKVDDIGDIRYKDYATYIKEKGKPFADERRRLYRKRHNCQDSKKGTGQYYACNILW